MFCRVQNAWMEISNEPHYETVGLVVHEHTHTHARTRLSDTVRAHRLHCTRSVHARGSSLYVNWTRRSHAYWVVTPEAKTPRVCQRPDITWSQIRNPIHKQNKTKEIISNATQTPSPGCALVRAGENNHAKHGMERKEGHVRVVIHPPYIDKTEQKHKTQHLLYKRGSACDVTELQTPTQRSRCSRLWAHERSGCSQGCQIRLTSQPLNVYTNISHSIKGILCKKEIEVFIVKTRWFSDVTRCFQGRFSNSLP